MYQYKVSVSNTNVCQKSVGQSGETNCVCDEKAGGEGSRGGVGQKETTSNGTRKAIHGNPM